MQGLRVEPVFSGLAVEEMLGQEGHLLPPGPQGRHGDGHDLQPVEQVLAEGAVLELLPEVHVGGGHHADIHLHRSATAQGLHLAFLQHPQEAHLGAQGHGADFIEEDGAAMGLAELARCVLAGIREGPLVVAEELRFKKVLGDGTTVDRHEGFGGIGAHAVDGPGDDLFARPAFAQQQDRGAGGGGASCPGQHILHGRAGAHEAEGQRLGCAELRGGARARTQARHGGLRTQQPPANGAQRAPLRKGLAIHGCRVGLQTQENGQGRHFRHHAVQFRRGPGALGGNHPQIRIAWRQRRGGPTIKGHIPQGRPPMFQPPGIVPEGGPVKARQLGHRLLDRK